MMITLTELIVLLPVLIISVTVIVILLSVAYNRNNLLHATLTIVGLCLAIASSLEVLWHHHNVYNVCQLICIDKFSVLYTILILISSALSGMLAYKWLLRYPNNCGDEFYILLLISSIGGVLLTATNHLVMLFVGIELLSLPLFGLVGYSFCNKDSLEASIKYIVLSGVSSAFLLLGMALVYASTGCLLFTEINKLLLISSFHACSYQQSMLLVGISIMMVGFGFKLSFVPFHLWVPDVYQGAPYPVSMYLATSSKVAIISALMRFFLMFPDQYSEIFHIFLSSVACCSILFGNMLAIQQSSIKRVLAYSSIAHTGYLLIGLIVLKKNCIVAEAIGVYLISYLIANIGVFSIVGIMSNMCDRDADSLYLYRGLFWKKPMLSVLFSIMLLSLVGMPMTLGFIGKFYLFILGISDKLWVFLIFMGIGSVIGMLYYFKIMINLYVRPSGKIYFLHSSSILLNWCSTIEGMIAIILTFFILFLGIYPQPIMYCLRLLL